VFCVNYREKFGLYYVNYSDPARPRIAKDSSHAMAEIIRTRHIPERKYVQEGDKAPEVHQHHLQ
jgi:beta-glucosidase/6-phospho-beta-glucosidase/beta-galactosidase